MRKGQGAHKPTVGGGGGGAELSRAHTGKPGLRVPSPAQVMIGAAGVDCEAHQGQRGGGRR